MLRHCPPQALLGAFDQIKAATGTAIYIFNLRRDEDGQYELDFETSATDIRLSGSRDAKFQRRRENQPGSSDVPIDYSLREYASILYLEPRMKIHLRGKKVRTNRILKSVSRRAAIRYQPRDAAIASDKAFKITFGFQEKAKEHLYGIML